MSQREILHAESGCRHTWAEIDLEAIKYNVRLFKQRMGSECRFMAVVKANGYGHGAVEAAAAAIEAGADELGVAILDEAIRLREAGIQHPILVLGYTAPQFTARAIRHQIKLTVFSDDVMDAVIKASRELGRIGIVHLKIETGMMRIGLAQPEDIACIAHKAVQSGVVMLEGAFTHFADADNENLAYTSQQFNRFEAIIAELEQRQISIPIRHCCNSAAAMRFSHMHLNMIRVGISLYGLMPSRQFPGVYPLKAAMSLKTRIVFLKKVPRGQSIGYGRTYTADKEILIATLPIGYADGLPRGLSNRGEVLVHGIRVPIVGRICMDQTTIDVSNVPLATVGDEVIVFGNHQNGALTVDELAASLDTINYEVVCAVNHRVPRLYS